jgi:hypothetical protein
MAHTTGVDDVVGAARPPKSRRWSRERVIDRKTGGQNVHVAENAKKIGV